MGGSAIVQVNRFPAQAACRAAGAVIGPRLTWLPFGARLAQSALALANEIGS